MTIWSTTIAPVHAKALWAKKLHACKVCQWVKFVGYCQSFYKDKNLVTLAWSTAKSHDDDDDDDDDDDHGN